MIRAVPYTPLWLGGALWLLVTGALLYGTAWQLYQNFLFDHHSQSTVGTVERKFMQVGQGKHGKTYTPCLDYRYQVDRMVAHGQSTVHNDTYSAVSEGGDIPILYLPDRPAHHRIDLPAENQRIHLLTFGLTGASLLLSLGGTCVLIYQVRRNKLNRFLLTNGLSCQGIVTGIPYDLVGKAQTRRYYLTFTFRDNQGRERTGSTWYLRAGDEERWREGNPIRVYFDPGNSERFTVELRAL